MIILLEVAVVRVAGGICVAGGKGCRYSRERCEQFVILPSDYQEDLVAAVLGSGFSVHEPYLVMCPSSTVQLCAVRLILCTIRRHFQSPKTSSCCVWREACAQCQWNFCVQSSVWRSDVPSSCASEQVGHLVVVQYWVRYWREMGRKNIGELLRVQARKEKSVGSRVCSEWGKPKVVHICYPLKVGYQVSR